MKKRKDGRYEKSIVIDGKRKLFYGKTQREVMEKIMQFEEEKEAGPLFSALADEWETEEEKRVEYNTMKPYRACVRRAKERFDGKRITEITPKQVNTFILWLADQNYAAKTVKHHLSVISMICRKAILEGYIETNPAELVSVPTGLKKERRELPSDADMQKVIYSLDKTFGLFAYFILYTGLRKGEALALTYMDIANNEITVNKSVYFDGIQPKIKWPKTQAGMRKVPVLSPLEDILPNKKTGPLFPGMSGGLMTESEYRTMWNQYTKETGIECTSHQLRHAFATILFEAGINEKDAQEIMGHADISTTRNIYTHIREARQKRSVSKIEEYIATSDFRQKYKIDDNKAE